MPWRARYLVPRPHPLAMSTYVLVLLLGAFFIFGVFDSRALTLIIGVGWQYLWEWMMLLGGLGGIIGVQMRQDLEVGLLLEEVGAGTSGIGMFVYAACILDVFGFTSEVWLLLAVIAIGCTWRAGQAHKDRQLAEALGRKADQYRHEQDDD